MNPSVFIILGESVNRLIIEKERYSKAKRVNNKFYVVFKSFTD